jgi:hypothetical protein
MGGRGSCALRRRGLPFSSNADFLFDVEDARSSRAHDESDVMRATTTPQSQVTSPPSSSALLACRLLHHGGSRSGARGLPAQADATQGARFQAAQL